MLKKLINIEQNLINVTSLYEDLPCEEKKRYRMFSLSHHLTCGLQVITDILDNVLERLSDGELMKYDIHQMYYDKTGNEYIVEKFEYTVGDTPMYSIVNGFESFQEALKCISSL